MQRGVYDLLLASCGNLAFAPAARGIVGQHVWPPGGEPGALRRGAGSKPAFQRRAVLWRQWQSGGSVHAEHGTKARSEVQGDWRSLH